MAESTSYSHNGLNQMTAAGATSFTYDGRGNLASEGTKTYSYDVENRLTAVSGGATLAYDPLGRLYEVSDGVTATKFLTDGAEVIAEYDAAGSTVLRRYVHGAGTDEALVWYEGSGTSDRRWLAADERDSITTVIPKAHACPRPARKHHAVGPFAALCGQRVSPGWAAWAGAMLLDRASRLPVR